MVARPFVGRIKPAAEPLMFTMGNNNTKQASKLQKYFNKQTLNLQSTLLGGALLQLSLCILLPTQWAIVPATVVLLGCLINSAVQSCTGKPPSPESYLENVVLGRTTAQLPSPDGTLGPAAADKPLVVFNLGVQWNHPLGAACPSGAELIRRFSAMNADLLQRRAELGLLGLSSWKEAESSLNRDGDGVNRALLATYFFKDEASIARFAHEELHRGAWDWYAGARLKHIGLFHETFVVPARNYETMYVNCSPLLMGRCVDRCETEEGERWVSALVSADTPALKTQYARMGREGK